MQVCFSCFRLFEIAQQLLAWLPSELVHSRRKSQRLFISFNTSSRSESAPVLLNTHDELMTGQWKHTSHTFKTSLNSVPSLSYINSGFGASERWTPLWLKAIVRWLIGALAVHFLASAVSMLSCPWERHWTPNCPRRHSYLWVNSHCSW